MKKIAVMIMISLLFPWPASASCEGVFPSRLLTAWYDPASEVLIKEIGDDHLSLFVWQGVHQEVDIFETYLHSIYYNTKPILSWGWGDAVGPLPPIVQRLRDRAMKQGLTKQKEIEKKLKTIDDGDAEHYQSVIKATRGFISEETKFELLVQQASCPYVVKDSKSALYRTLSRLFTLVYSDGNTDSKSVLMVSKKGKDGRFKKVGIFSSHIPHDENSETVLHETRCFGRDGVTDFLAVRWEWECQGDGDAIIPVKDIRKK